MTAGARRKVVLFERVALRNVPLLRLHLALGISPYFLNADADCERSSWLQRAMGDGRVRRIEFVRPMRYGIDDGSDGSIDVVEADSSSFEGGLIDATVALFETPAIRDAYRRAAIDELTICSFLASVAERAAEAVGEEVAIVPSSIRRAYAYDVGRGLLARGSGSLRAAAPLPGWLRILVRGYALLRWSKAWATLARVFAAELWDRLARWGAPDEARRQRYDLAFAVTSPARQLSSAARGLDFLATDLATPGRPSLVVPIAPVPAGVRRRVAERGMALATPGGSTGGRHWLRYLRMLTRAGRSPAWLMSTAALLAHTHRAWTGFVNRYSIGALLSCADTELTHVARNLVLRAAGAVTWYYTDSGNFGLGPKDGSDDMAPRAAHWCHLSYDHFALWNARMRRYLAAHPHAGRMHVVGCPWADHMAVGRARRDRSRLWDTLRERGYRDGQRLVSVFDSWYHPQGVNVAEDLARFVDDIAAWVDMRDDVFVVLRTKKSSGTPLDEDSGAPLVFESRARLARRRNATMLDGPVDTSELGAMSEVVVSFPFTSVTHEALCAGQRAVYFDPSNKYRGSYFDRFPGLLLHGPDQLCRGLDRLLETTDDEFVSAITEAAGGPDELYLGTGGIARFRELVLSTIR